MNADGTLVEFGEVQDLVDGLERIDVGGMRGIHFVNVGGDETARSAMFSIGLTILDPEVLHFKTADWGGHPTILVTMIVDAAELSDFPADGHAFERVVLENQVAGVATFREEEIFFERLRTNGVVEDVVLNIFKGEVAVGYCCEIFHPVSDDELFGGELFGHGSPPRGKYNARMEVE